MRRIMTGPWAGLIAACAPLLLGAALTGCGRSVAPTSPRSVVPARLGSGARLTPRSNGTSVSLATPYRPDQVVLRCTDTSDEDGVEGEYGLAPLARAGTAVLCDVPAGSDPLLLSQTLCGDSRVASAEPNYLAESAESRGHSWAFDDGNPNLDGVFDQSATARVGLASAHQVTRGSGVLVAVLDTGVDPTHPLLASHLVPGYDFVANDSDPTELPQGIDSNGDGVADGALGHGSHVAGIVALVAPEASILPLRVLDSDGVGAAFDIARAIDYAVARHARVINLSLGMLVEDPLIADALLRAQAAGGVIVTSAGNWGAESPEEFPASSSTALAIAATDSVNLPTPFTSFGGFVAMCAPGDHIRSAYWNGHTAVWSGTSMSAPWVAGAAALLLSVRPAWRQEDVFARLGATATPVPVADGSDHFGSGILNLGAALASFGTPGGSDMPVQRAAPR